MRVVISSGHGKYVRGASGYLDEVDEAREVVDTVAQQLMLAGVDVTTYHDDWSTTQNENLNRIVDFHNAQERDLDVSVHFNANTQTSKPVGTEVLYVTQAELAGELATAIAAAGELVNRGGKYRSDLFFLNNTTMPAVLIEVCFVDSSADAATYRNHFQAICEAIAAQFDDGGDEVAPPEPEPPAEGALMRVKGRCSWFGGPDDHGVSPSEGLAFLYDFEDAPHLFLHEQPLGTTGLARRLDPQTFFVACRWNYNVTPKDMLRDHSYKALVRANGKEYFAYPADWGPHDDTGRVADLSIALMEALALSTDDTVEVIYPA